MFVMKNQKRLLGIVKKKTISAQNFHAKKFDEKRLKGLDGFLEVINHLSEIELGEN